MPSVTPVMPKVRIERKHLAVGMNFRKSYDAGIRKRHWRVGISAQQRGDGRHFFGNLEPDFNNALMQLLDQQAWLSTSSLDQEASFSQDGFAGQ